MRPKPWGAERHVSSQQSSADVRAETPTSKTGAACVPSGQLLTASRLLMTAHCSPVPHLPFATCGVGQPRHDGLEHATAICVVAKHVEACAGGCEQHDAALTPLRECCR